jgi:CheY-like chemotaxis protein
MRDLLESAPELQSQSSQFTILLVEDEDFVRNVTREVLEISGYRVLEAIDAEGGIELYNQFGDEIDLLLTDLIMPGLNGRELANKLSEAGSTIKVIFMSGYTDNAVIREDLSNLESNYLQKPFTLDSLIAKVGEVLGSRQSQLPALTCGVFNCDAVEEAI